MLHDALQEIPDVCRRRGSNGRYRDGRSSGSGGLQDGDGLDVDGVGGGI